MNKSSNKKVNLSREKNSKINSYRSNNKTERYFLIICVYSVCIKNCICKYILSVKINFVYKNVKEISLKNKRKTLIDTKQFS